jgi:hypothetical protein
VYSNGHDENSVEICINEDDEYAQKESHEAAIEQYELALNIFNKSFHGTTDLCDMCKHACDHMTFVTKKATPDPIEIAMKEVMEQQAQELFKQYNKNAMEPVEYDFFEDEYHAPEKGPTYTIRRKVWNPDEVGPTKEQVKAGVSIGYVKAFIEGMVEQSTTKMEPFFVPPDPESLTCHGCNQRDNCPFVDDAYNTHGDCLYMK